MQWLEVLVLSLIQGLTEFLPISSSAHLLLVPVFTHWQDQGLAFDIALHFGSLLAVIVYFRRDLYQLFIAWCGSFRGRQSAESKLAWAIVLSTLPVGLVGILTKSFIEEHMRSGVYMAYSLIIFGLLLGWADWRYTRASKKAEPPVRNGEYQITNRQVVIIALSQVLALIPGTSRSGITMTAGLLTGLTREASAKFSFLLSIPVIALAALLQTVQLGEAQSEIVFLPMAVGTLLSALSAYACIHWFLGLIRKYGLQPFVWYRLLLGGYLLYLYY
ncbi:undecaprenyl-diphosphate phosphatase [Gilvimarinus sp. SDUM040013]|uniref:Undecaprenyl-diphosphatase n=1 Tax=Gilvimarinus gilvus TaxID=3058038 RepID=A0ABU4RZ60_9GAMM|nr:undecaprenyl-diphosphate phosphatase [Gilvimarinus sp. SDUM040013]MDO3387661.1 undecaprenyl-diphosphate phosphatase [Gilvimarinus sp. SDUM040013]MDX6848898.1 undecaprenyl-diphosphate phosphatase [Gilvimarinus sp. SDUM040013]